jgi:DNA (cytosine-5)-methyltransferase 1
VNYYNENDPYAAQWLRNLIAAGHLPDGVVDERSIVDVRAADLKGYDQHHFFAGIGGWPHALRLAGWPDDRPVWTGSCPCQPLSGASRGQITAHDLWPAWRSLVAATRPREIFSEQVPHKGSWLDGVCDDLETLGYEVGACVLPAVSVGKDHARPRIYFVGHTDRDGKPIMSVDGKMAGLQRDRGHAGGMVSTNGISRRMAVLGAFGNAIVPQVAAVFIEAFMVVSFDRDRPLADRGSSSCTGS